MTSENTQKRVAPNLWNIGFGVAVLVFALFSLFVWFPADIPTGFFFINAIGREEPGDAFFPILLASLLALLAAVQIAVTIFQSRMGHAGPVPGTLSIANFRFLAIFAAMVCAGLAIMYWLGPGIVQALAAIGITEGTYRQYSDTAPYKYIGYIVGGLLMTVAMIAWTEGRLRRTAVLSVVITLATSILIFDVFLRNVLLPPNADY